MLLPLATPNAPDSLPSLQENVYIREYRACIAGFSLSTMTKEGPLTGSGGVSTASLPTFTAGGSLPWMSPELLDPSRLDEPDPRPTKESDCFALGMVVYEVRVAIPASPPTLIIVHRARRCYADLRRTMTGITR